MMVCTRDTGIFDVALELSRWPVIWNPARGRVVRMTSLDGYLMGCFRAGIEVRIRGNLDASHENSKQYTATKANCSIVRVAGLSKAVRIDLDEVFVRAEDQYQVTHSPYTRGISMIGTQPGRRGLAITISFHDTGARRAPAISCALWLTLADLI